MGGRFGNDHVHTSRSESLAPGGIDFVIGHQDVDRIEVGQVGQARAAELGAVGDNNHLVGGAGHGSLGFDEEEVAVEVTPLVDTGHAENRPANV